MSEFFENFSDHVEDDAGGLAALGGMAHLKNQSAQRNELKKQRELLQEQLASVKAAERTEKEREFLRKKAESVKAMRKVMANISHELNQLEKLND
jgi:hypothetical protein